MTPALLLALALPPAMPAAAPDTALLTYEAGTLVGVDWLQRRGPWLRTLSVLTQSGVRDAWIELGEGGAATGSSTRVGQVSQELSKPIVQSFADGSIYWSDQIASSLDQAVRRAAALGEAHAVLAGASLYRDAHVPVEVERAGATDWVVSCNHKRYLATTDANGNLLAATLPDFGVVIERRVGFRPEQYPAWAPYAAPPGAPYRALEVKIPAPEGHVLAGTLTEPAGAGPFPAAVLITGLSPHERNNGDAPWMPFRDVADALTRHGFAVLRVDDRGVGTSTGDRGPSTTFDEANDVRTELRWLRARHEVDTRRVALVGYSEGGLIAPMVASADPGVAGIVTLAGPGVPGPELARYQIEAAVVRDTSIAPADREAEIRKQLADTLTARERSFMGIDPLSYARRVRCPALILQGGSDLHVPVRSAEHLALAMREGGNRDVTVRIFPNVSHAFLPDTYGLDSNWATLPGFMTSPDVLRAITDWTAARFGEGAGHARRSGGR